ncbi:hypothetical protein K474DRAFT_1712653 [Panus rudis PR-1116 ss-1]|nr:hypothetical protein K474DRAFT_1712653 [Panus rudis PR-1116 ss-1]
MLEGHPQHPPSMPAQRKTIRKTSKYSPYDVAERHLDITISVEEFSDLTDLEESSVPRRSSSKVATRVGSAHKKTNDTRDMKRLVKGKIRLASKLVARAQAQENTVYMTSFSLQHAVDHPTMKFDNVMSGEREETSFRGDAPQRAVSADGYDLIYHFPSAVRGPALEALENISRDWAASTTVKPDAANNSKGGYRIHPGSLSGTTRLATQWHAIGQTVRVPSTSGQRRVAH